MEYTINNITISGDVVITDTTITLDTGEILNISIPHLLPNMINAINQNIVNRAIVEQDLINNIE
jgi:hypothetical protein